MLIFASPTALGEGSLAKILDTGRCGQTQCGGKAALVGETLLLRNTAFGKHFTPFLSTQYIYIYIFSQGLFRWRNTPFEKYLTLLLSTYIHTNELMYIRRGRKGDVDKSGVECFSNESGLAKQVSQQRAPPPPHFYFQRCHCHASREGGGGRGGGETGGG